MNSFFASDATCMPYLATAAEKEDDEHVQQGTNEVALGRCGIGIWLDRSTPAHDSGGYFFSMHRSERGLRKKDSIYQTN